MTSNWTPEWLAVVQERIKAKMNRIQPIPKRFLEEDVEMTKNIYIGIENCAICGKPFEFYKSVRKNPKYCSRRCQNNSPERKAISAENGKKNKGLLLGNKNPNWRGGKLWFICKNCGDPFQLSKWQLKKQDGKFCSINCSRDYVSYYKKPESHNRLHRNMKRAVSRYIREKKNYRKWTDLVGYSLNDLIKHLQKLFKPGMTWDNYGEWHIDHKIPVSAFNFTKTEHIDFKKSWALSNLQPMWAKDNMYKSSKLNKPFQPSLEI